MYRITNISPNRAYPGAEMQLTTEGLIRALYPAFDSGAIYPLTHDLADFKSLMQPL